MQRVWYAPKRRKKCQSLPEALAWSNKNNTLNSKAKRRGAEADKSALPDSPKSGNITLPTTKRSVLEDLEIQSATKKQKLDTVDGASSLLALANAGQPAMPAATFDSSASVVPSAPPVSHHRVPSLLEAYQHSIYAQPLIRPTTAHQDLVARSILARRHSSAGLLPIPSLPLSSFGGGLHSDGLLAQDLLLARRSEQLLASRMLLEREMLLDASLMRGSAFPHNLFLG